MVYKYKISLKQSLLLLVQPMIVYVLVLGALYYYYKGLPFVALIAALSFIFLTDTLPALILHIQYLAVNKGVLFIVDEENRTFSYKSSKLDTDIESFNNINSLEYHASYGRGTGVYSFDRYRYYKIIMNGGKELPA
jgi:hypothetical protein